MQKKSQSSGDFNPRHYTYAVYSYQSSALIYLFIGCCTDLKEYNAQIQTNGKVAVYNNNYNLLLVTIKCLNSLMFPLNGVTGIQILCVPVQFQTFA